MAGRYPWQRVAARPRNPREATRWVHAGVRATVFEVVQDLAARFLLGSFVWSILSADRRTLSADG